ncbi:hypothetical protein [Thiocapsa sp.]|uniref:DUF7281 domain-containing protein n=1 Tax=Thiocapsa sp. TaxID=2024551 RepID=UPI003593B203
MWVFVDYDPAGLLIAAGLPRLAGIIAAEPARLVRDLAHALPERYQDQFPKTTAALDASGNEQVRALRTLSAAMYGL